MGDFDPAENSAKALALHTFLTIHQARRVVTGLLAMGVPQDWIDRESTEAILTAWTCREALGWFRPLDEEARRG